jgi:hypothetical protein
MVAKAQLEWAGVCDLKQSRGRPTAERLRILTGGSSSRVRLRGRRLRGPGRMQLPSVEARSVR